MQHNHWLDWKLKHGLATRGRVGGVLHPKGLIAGVLYRYYFAKRAAKPENEGEGRMFKQKVGGTLGASGEVK